MDIFLCKPTRIAERYLLLSRSLAISAGAVCEKKILMSHVVMLHGFECNVDVGYKYVSRSLILPTYNFKTRELNYHLNNRYKHLYMT